MRSPLARTLALVVGVCAALALICECFACRFSVHRATSSLIPLPNIVCMHSGSLVPSKVDHSGGLLKSWGLSLGAYPHCDDALHGAARVMKHQTIMTHVSCTGSSAVTHPAHRALASSDGGG